MATVGKAHALQLAALFAAGKVTTGAQLGAPAPKSIKPGAAPAGPPYKIPEPGPLDPYMDEMGRIHRPKTRKKK